MSDPNAPYLTWWPERAELPPATRRHLRQHAHHCRQWRRLAAKAGPELAAAGWLRAQREWPRSLVRHGHLPAVRPEPRGVG